ncbi:MFS transporter [Nocardia ignorata]|uniref:DHA2 family multidrug resistance protein-like MFS transporter n=1 Tax=Nocardia ignorata TaxID=145285 RepID=A0A4R6NZL7_NOCIG|nr:MFS transporter [Nocardia ignorata]TDP30824.1 DHA2 family multidrug resistance protein-like MFS transporter [Nocardia ignorata]
MAAQKATIREWLGLGLLLLPMLALATDLTVLFFALPAIDADLRPSASQIIWVTHVYGFLIAGFLVTAGRLSDRIGPRRLLLIGASAFAVLSVVAGLATSAEMLIAARAALGIAGATLMPALFSLLRTMFRDDTQRRMAIAIAFSAFTVGGAVGPVLGGVLLEFFWWGSVFLINVPPLVVLLLGGPRLLPERAERNRARVDPLSVVLSVAGMLAIVYGLQELAAGHSGDGGQVWPQLLVVGAGLGMSALFVRRQRRIPEPLFDLELLDNRRVRVSLVALVLMGISVTGLFYLFTQYLMLVAGMSPLRAGVSTMPYIVANIVGAMLAPAVAARRRPTTVVGGGITLAALGALAFASVVGSGLPLPALVAAIALVGFGQGTAGALISDLIIASAPTEKTGSAASAQEVGGELGTALGIAAAGVASVVAYRHYLRAHLVDAPESVARELNSGIHDGAAFAGGLADHALLGAVEDAIGSGTQIYAGIAGVVLGVAAGLVLLRRGGAREASSVRSDSAAVG